MDEFERMQKRVRVFSWILWPLVLSIVLAANLLHGLKMYVVLNVLIIAIQGAVAYLTFPEKNYWSWQESSLPSIISSVVILLLVNVYLWYTGVFAQMG